MHSSPIPYPPSSVSVSMSQKIAIISSSRNVVAPEEAMNLKVLAKTPNKSKTHWALLMLSAFGMFVGFISASLLMRFYYSRGGSRRWLGGWVQTAGWPLCGFALLVVYFHNRKSTNYARLAPYNLKTTAIFIFLGCIISLDNFLYSWGMSYLPASTAGILTSTQLAFNSLFALVILRKKVSPYIWNSIVLVTSSVIILGLHSSSDKLANVTHAQTLLGYLVTIMAAALYGLILSLSELVFTNVLGGKSTMIVLQMQTCTALVATVVSSIGMAINHDFEAIFYKEASRFAAGRGAYFATLVLSTVAWQAAFLGTMGVIFLSSSLLAGVILTVVVPVGAIFAYIFFQDSFGGLKVVALFLSLWGFVSYVYGGYQDNHQVIDTNTTNTGESSQV